MLEQDFEESLGYWTYMTSNALEKAMNEELAAHGITYQQWQVLAWIALKEGELAQKELADKLKIVPATLAGILDRMERDGWVCRETDPNDRRKKIVRPTPAVEPVWKRMVACLKRVRTRAYRGLNADQVQYARSVLAVVLSNLGTPIPIREKAT